MKKTITENQLRSIITESIINILKESKWNDEKYDEDFTPDPLKGNFEAYINGGDTPIMGIYYYHIDEEERTYDYAGSKDYILDNIEFIGEIPQHIKDYIRDSLQERLNEDEIGDITLEIEI